MKECKFCLRLIIIENLLAASGPSSPSNLSSITLVGSTGSCSVDKSDDTPTEEKNVVFYGKAPKSPLPERKRPQALSTVSKANSGGGSIEERRTIVPEMTTNIQPPTPTSSEEHVGIAQNGHSTVTVSPISPPSTVTMAPTTPTPTTPSLTTSVISTAIQSAIASTAMTATAIVPNSPTHMATTQPVSPSKMTTATGGGVMVGIQQNTGGGSGSGGMGVTTGSNIVSPQAQSVSMVGIGVSQPHLSVHSGDRRPSVGCNQIPHAALCQHRYSLQLNGDGGVKVGGISLLHFPLIFD